MTSVKIGLSTLEAAAEHQGGSPAEAERHEDGGKAVEALVTPRDQRNPALEPAFSDVDVAGCDRRARGHPGSGRSRPCNCRPEPGRDRNAGAVENALADLHARAGFRYRRLRFFEVDQAGFEAARFLGARRSRARAAGSAGRVRRSPRCARRSAATAAARRRRRRRRGRSGSARSRIHPDPGDLLLLADEQIGWSGPCSTTAISAGRARDCGRRDRGSRRTAAARRR